MSSEQEPRKESDDRYRGLEKRTNQLALALYVLGAVPLLGLLMWSQVLPRDSTARALVVGVGMLLLGGWSFLGLGVSFALVGRFFGPK